MLIRDAEIEGRRTDLRCRDGRIQEIAPRLPPGPSSEHEIDARGGALLPGLHDHHLHLLALAAALDSVVCGPPAVADRETLRARLQAARPSREGWLRGTGYHESVAGVLDRQALDALRDDVPVRIQHRSGSMWLLNSAAIRALDLDRLGRGPEGVERDAAGAPTGRLFRLDGWLRERLPSGSRPSLAAVGAELVRCGVTGVTDATPTTGPEERAWLESAQRSGDLPQHILLMGPLDLTKASRSEGTRIGIGARKRLLDEPALPDLAELIDWIAAAHARSRPVAFHAVTRTELLFALAALEAAGPLSGDRIEHASVAPAETLSRIRALGLTVVTQPNFVAERGDAYRREVDPLDLPSLYRLRSWLEAGVPLGGGTDAPFGGFDPWRAMRAAVDRQTLAGAVLGPDERITPEAALALFTTGSQRPGGPVRRVAVGRPADLCLLDRPWAEARQDLSRERVRATFIEGERIEAIPGSTR